MERVERGEDAEVESSALKDLARESTEGKTFWTPPADNELPAEPAPDAAGKSDGRQVMQGLRAFHIQGTRPGDSGSAESTAALPALLHPYRDLSRVRYEFPVLLNGTGSGAAVRPLTDVIDEVIGAAAEPDDSGQQLRHAVLRLEAAMRSLVENHDGDRLPLVWDRAAATLFETTNLPDDKAAAMRDAIALARKKLAADGELISCNAEAPARIFASCASAFWMARCAAWRDELDALIRQLDNILVADFDHSEAAMKPEHLRETLGASDEMDVQAMSSLLRSAPHGAGLPEQRRNRVRETIAILKAMQPIFSANPKSRARAPIRCDAVFKDMGKANEEHARRMEAMTAFFKAVRIARLEIQNQYRDAVHDAYFSQFGEHHLTRDELALVPPVLARITGSALTESGAGELLAALNSSAGIKVMLELQDLYDVQNDMLQPGVNVGWPVRLATMAMGLNNAYVMQAPASRAVFLRERMLDGMRVAGPALFCVGVPTRRDDGLNTYLGAAAATESRLLPVVVFDPSRGDVLAERIDIAENPQKERVWPVDPFTYRNGAGQETTVDLAFTPADLLFGDPRLSGHFWTAPVAWWHDAMLPLHEMLELPQNEAAGRIPYILTVDANNRVGRVVVSRAVVEFSRGCRACWMGLRESGGVENSFAARQLAAERERISAEKDAEVAEIEKNYVAQLEQDVSDLTREIVQRIASQLMGAEGTAVAIPMPSAPPTPRDKAPVAPAEAKPAPAAAPEEDEAIVIDDAYIDTPLCTSCNECTQLNPRIFAYNANKQAEIKDATAGPFSDIVTAAELCPVHIIHPGKPKNPGEPGLEEWIKRAQKYN
jgi:ferredoxin